MQQPVLPLSFVRQKVLDAFQALGVGDGRCSESLLMQDGYFVGRRFCQGGLQAVWLAGERHITIFSQAGEVIETRLVEEADAPLKKAA